jgi:hypothetical protein
MIEAAQRKLREARFFYGHLARERHRSAPPIQVDTRETVSNRSEPEAFRFYFSAFIGAARSVTWAMKSEDTERYLVWEPTWKAQLTTEEEKLEKLTNDLRLDEVKRLGRE